MFELGLGGLLGLQVLTQGVCTLLGLVGAAPGLGERGLVFGEGRPDLLEAAFCLLGSLGGARDLAIRPFDAIGRFLGEARLLLGLGAHVGEDRPQ